eukprot:661871-Hanusia_phi.AAC.2
MQDGQTSGSESTCLRLSDDVGDAGLDGADSNLELKRISVSTRQSSRRVRFLSPHCCAIASKLNPPVDATAALVVQLATAGEPPSQDSWWSRRRESPPTVERQMHAKLHSHHIQARAQSRWKHFFF